MNIKLACIFLLTFLSTKLSAQLCQGTLGDPIINISFGAGSNPGAPISAAATGYQYVSNDCPNDGYYTVRGNSNNCFNGSWHSVNSDHTGNAGGFFMLVNASIQPSAFYLDTVRGLCGNTTYEFAAWVMNVIRPESCSGNSNQPNLTFRIERTDGTLIQSYNSGNIIPTASPTWKQYGFFFTTPASTPDIVLRLINNAAGGCGNDLALDDITFRPCGPLLIPSIATETGNTVSLCEGTAGSFNFQCQVSGGFISPSFQWQESINGSTWVDIAGQTSSSLTKSFSGAEPIGVYSYRLAVAEAGNMASLQCRIASSTLTVKVVANPVTTATNNGPGCIGSSLTLSATGGTDYQWTGPAAFSGSGSTLTVNNLQVSNAGKYYVRVENAEGCQLRDSTIVQINPSPIASTGFSQIAICAGDSATFSASGGTLYEWQPVTGLSSPSDPSPKASPADDIQYKVIVSNSFNCSDTAYIDLSVINAPQANAGPDRSMIEGEPVTLSGTVSGENTDYFWVTSPYISNTMLLQPEVNPPADTEFVLTVTSRDGCGSARDTVKVLVYKALFAPNAFTPNDDGLNDSWLIPALSAYTQYDLYIFNRYGQVVFQLKNENLPWDGKLKGKRLPVGSYVYLIDFKKYMAPIKGTVMILK